VLEFGDATYSRRYGGDRVIHRDVANVSDEDYRHSTFLVDLTKPNDLPSAAFDCVIFTHCLQFMFDSRAALQTLDHIIKPTGVLLAAVSVNGKLTSGHSAYEHFWSFAPQTIEQLLTECFAPASSISVQAYATFLRLSARSKG
jgi:SAM-dependent methyltransferase